MQRKMDGRLLFVLLFFIPGCAEELHPVAFKTTQVRGVVLEHNTPVRGGFIEFVPVDGTVGQMHSATIDSDGKFVVDGVAVGQNAVGLVALRSTMPRQALGIFDTLRTPIRRQIPASESFSVSIDLYEELIRFQAEREVITP